MDRETALTRLRAHEAELRAMGIAHVALFGSTARGEADANSDIDLAITLRSDARLGWDFFTLEERVGALLGVETDIVTEPVSRAGLQREIDRDRIDAF